MRVCLVRATAFGLGMLTATAAARADEPFVRDELTLEEPRVPATPPRGEDPVRKLALLPSDQSVYAPPAAPRGDEDGFNAGGVNFDLTFRYTSDYVYRGVDRSEVGGKEDAPNLQFEGRMTFDLGKLPHPFVGAFVNVYDADPISRFQEIRPFFGFTWNLRPFDVEVGNITYIYPERDEDNTGEVYGRISFDDSWLWKTDRKILTPYVMVAYDYDKYEGWYAEAGLRHDFEFEGTGLTLSGVGHIAYVLDNAFFARQAGGKDSGLQHYQVGMIANYSLNRLFDVPSTRFGTWSLEAYVFYTDRTGSELRADKQIWGGIGIGFKY
ncbi:MAG TPA: hypothetical protein VEA69_24025 [Tepidisphaeraceae bacterium]|nr:hypothetical protein [Tepidisphaeraceae bacterium]